MSWVNRIRKAGKWAADTAMRQPSIRRHLEAAQAVYEQAREELDTRFEEAESVLWDKIRQFEADVHKADRQRKRRDESRRFYDVLGLEPGASLDEVKRAYRRRMHEVHPDRHAHNPTAEADAHARSQDINRAYAELTALLTGRENRAAH